MNSPCQNCPHRKPTCHDRCEEYIEYHDELVAAKNKVRDAYNALEYLLYMSEKRKKKARVRK